MVLEKTPESPLDSTRSSLSILKEINSEFSLEGLMLKLKLQYSGHLMRRADSLEETLMVGKIECIWRRGWQRMRWFATITDSVDVDLRKLQELVEDKGALCATVHGLAKSWTWQWLNKNNVGTHSFSYGTWKIALLVNYFVHPWFLMQNILLFKLFLLYR